MRCGCLLLRMFVYGPWESWKLGFRVRITDFCSVAPLIFHQSLAGNRGKTLFFCILLFLLGSGDEILVAFFDGLLHTARLEIAMIFRVSIGSLDWSENEPLWKKS